MKTRLQSSVGFRNAGGFHGIYKGLGSAMVGSVPSAALFWCTYDFCKSNSLSLAKRHNVHLNESFYHMACAICAELSACIIRVPVDNVKQKMQAHMFHTTRETFAGIWAMDGARGFYIGTAGTIARDAPFAVIQFPLYERFKRLWSEWNGKDVSQLEASRAAICGSAAGAIAGALTTPMDVIKTRLMLSTDRHGVRYTGVVNVLQRIILHEGAGTLFSGVAPRVIWISIGGFVFFGSCEWAKKMLHKYN